MTIDDARGKERVFIHRVCFGARTETFRSLSVFTLRTIGPSQWALSISCRRGCAKILKNEAFASGSQTRQLHSLDGNTPSHCRRRPTVVGEIKSIRFPRVSGLSSRRGHKIRHRRFAFSSCAIIPACWTSGTKYKSVLYTRAVITIECSKYSEIIYF